MSAGLPELMTAQLTIYTDALIIRGTVGARQRRASDILNEASGTFLLVEEVTIDEHGSRGRPITAPFAQVRLATILFVLAELAVADEADLGEAAHPAVLLAVPPFNVAGSVPALSGDKDFREAAAGLPAGFFDVAGASYWSEPLREGRRRGRFAAVNASRVQAVAPYRDVDPWAGLDQARVAGPTLLADEAQADEELGPAEEA